MTSIENKRLDIMEDKLTTVEQKLDRVLTALLGDDLNIDKGLVAEFKELRERVTKLEYMKNKVIWMSAGAGITGGVVIAKIVEWIRGIQ